MCMSCGMKMTMMMQKQLIMTCTQQLVYLNETTTTTTGVKVYCTQVSFLAHVAHNKCLFLPMLHTSVLDCPHSIFSCPCCTQHASFLVRVATQVSFIAHVANKHLFLSMLSHKFLFLPMLLTSIFSCLSCTQVS